ncbi:hypothetical protein [Alicyclobacillus fastidiosus]|uniref:Uncharacterized protein n=1 Tax=Alicyclobacillus fastidiosus TaxID=392011 RepID=A0ABV5AK41_9BACL|nr:hypothetical protein [Alicyclobacillus fastidiosus]WEH10994.1 hypothetical protein PYS47_07190 [Alicyclobacillus fastidiosus]
MITQFFIGTFKVGIGIGAAAIAGWLGPDILDLLPIDPDPITKLLTPDNIQHIFGQEEKDVYSFHD